MIIIGVDYHSSFHQIAFAEKETGECGERRLRHSDGEAEKHRPWSESNCWMEPSISEATASVEVRECSRQSEVEGSATGMRQRPLPVRC